MTSCSLGPVVNILAIFSNAYILKNKIIKRYHIKGIGCPLVISINIDILTRKRKHKKEEKMIRLEPRLDEQQQRKQPPSPTSKVSLDDFDQGVLRWTIASMYSLKKVLPTLDNIRTELKQSIGYTGSKGRLRKDLLNTKSAYTRCSVNQKELMERQDVVLSRIRYLRMARELREVGYIDETNVHTCHAVPKRWQDSTTGLKIPFSKGNLRIVEYYDPWVCTITTI